MDRSRTLFVTWDGPAQNYMEALFFPIFERAQSEHVDIGVFQFTWAGEEVRRRIAASAARHDLEYRGSDALRRPRQLAVPAMIAYGATRLIAEVDRGDWDTLMPRSIIPVAMCLIAMKARPHLRLVFDADGLMADERVDFAGWSATGLQYRLFRDWEAQGIRRATSVIVRSAHAKRILANRAGAHCDPDKIHVIPNAKDDTLFAPGDESSRAETRAKMGIDADAPLLIYAGSLGPQYHPLGMLQLFEQVHALDPSAHFLILSGMQEVAQELLPQINAEARENVIIHRCSSDEVAPLMASADLGLSLRQPSFSQQAVCPIKIAEYLLCGLSVVMLRGVGDLDERLVDSPALRTLDQVSPESLEQAARWCIEDVMPKRASIRETSRQAGLDHFRLDDCADQLAALLAPPLSKPTRKTS